MIDSGRLPQAREKLKGLQLYAHGEPVVAAVVLYLEAKLLFMERRFAESANQLERLLAIKLARPSELTADHLTRRELFAEPPYPEALKLMGLNHVLLNRLDRAEPFLRASAALVPNDYLARFHLGLLYYTTSRFAPAERELREVVKLRPSFIKGHDALGLTLEELGVEDEAMESYRRAVELSRRQARPDGAPYLNFGRFLMRKNRFAESLALLRRAVELAPDSAESYFLLGKALNKTGEEMQAIEALLRAAKLDPRYAEPHYLLGRIYLQHGRKADSDRELQIFHEIRKLRADAQEEEEAPPDRR